MKLLQRSFFSLALVAGVSIGASNAKADIAQLTGTITATTNANLFSTSQFGSQTFVPQGPNTGVFAGISATSPGVIHNINATQEPVGVPFNDPSWVVFPNGIVLDLTFIPVSTAAVCTGVGDTDCRPSLGSPIELRNQSPSGILASYTVDGVAHLLDGSTAPFFGVLSGQISDFATIDDLLRSGQQMITTSYSATITVSPTPEPSSFAMIGAGLIAAGALTRRLRRAVAKN